MAPTGSGRVVLHRLRLCSRPTPKIWTVRWAVSRDGSGKVLVPRVGVGMCADYCLAPDSQASMRTIAACLAYVIAPASDFTQAGLPRTPDMRSRHRAPMAATASATALMVFTVYQIGSYMSGNGPKPPTSTKA
jgi:hypothetical protein